MTEVEKLLKRLEGCKNFHITPGPKWNSLTLEERAKIINHSLDYGEEIEDIDNYCYEPPSTGKPQIDVREWLKEIYDEQTKKQGQD